MAITATTMSQDDHSNNKEDDDQHPHDLVMPGFRFHPTEEELIEFYLRRKVEGKRFSVELITFLDLYRYDPWELPALAAIGEKEWFFYVPRDRKYRNGDRPNRVTTSGYWKATGADRMIRSENFRPIGLKKTLVFYTGKAPKGVRTSWIMNEYRLPQHETERLQKAEISLCRVYKRAGVEVDHPSLPRVLPTRASSSSQLDKMHHGTATNFASMERLIQAFGSGGHSHHVADETEKMSETSGSSSTDHIVNNVGTDLGISNNNSYNISNGLAIAPTAPLEDDRVDLVQAHRQSCYYDSLVPNFGSSLVRQTGVDDLHRLVNFQQASINHYQTSEFSTFQQPIQPQPSPVPPSSVLQAGFSDRLWEWNSISEGINKDYSINSHHFK